MRSFHGITLFLSLCGMLAIFAAGKVSSSHAHGWQAPKAEAAVENPMLPTQNVIESGKAVFMDFCAACHGENARGTGRPVAAGGTVPPDLVRRLTGHSQGDFFWKINQGRGDMPGFGEDLSSDQIWSVILYIDSLSE